MSTEDVAEVTLHDFLPGHTSFPPGPALARDKVRDCPDIKFVYEEDAMMVPAPYWLCVGFVDNSMKDITLMSAIRKKDAVRPFTHAVVTHRPPASVLAKQGWQPVFYLSMEGLHWYSIRIEQWQMTTGGTLVARIKCDEKVTLKPVAYRGSNYFALNGIDPMVLESCGGNGEHAWGSRDDNDGQPPWMHYYDIGYVWRRPALAITAAETATAAAAQIAAGAPEEAV